jgi:hypothetical protein
LAIHNDSRPGWISHLHAMFLPAKDVRYIPVFWPARVGCVIGFASAYPLRSAACAAIDIGVAPYGCTGYRADGGGNIFSSPTPDLMTEYTAGERSNNCAGHVIAVAILSHPFPLDPASPFRCSNYSANRSYVCFKRALRAPPTVVVHRYGGSA